MDLYGKDRGNISLSLSLQPSNFNEEKLENVIVNTQRCFYDLKTTEINKRIQRLENRNKELMDSLKDMNLSIKILQEKTAQEISILNAQITSQLIKVTEYKNRVTTLEKLGIDDEFSHTTKIINISKKYKNTRLALISQIKLLSAKTNVLEDYKSMQQVLEKKLDAQNRSLNWEKEQMTETLHHIECRFKIDREKLKEELYKHLMHLADDFHVEVACHMPCSISKLLSENIAANNMVLTIAKDVSFKKRDYIQCKSAIKEYRRKINDARLSTKRSTLVVKLERSTTATLHEIRNNMEANLSKLNTYSYLTEDQYTMQKDNAIKRTRECETRVKNLEILLYREKEKLAIAKNQKQWISDQLQIHLQIFYDIQHVLNRF